MRFFAYQALRLSRTWKPSVFIAPVSPAFPRVSSFPLLIGLCRTVPGSVRDLFTTEGILRHGVRYGSLLGGICVFESSVVLTANSGPLACTCAKEAVGARTEPLARSTPLGVYLSTSSTNLFHISCRSKHSHHVKHSGEKNQEKRTRILSRLVKITKECSRTLCESMVLMMTKTLC